MVSTITTTANTGTPDDVMVSAIHRRELEEVALLGHGWCPPGGWTDPRTVDLRAVESGLRRLLS
ncbi:hypothetical protein OK074_5375 [Actinobacteria bacterium OK074]|nr:hypothetical protein OK074_5375 [Actinobacteria bacterium OK074]